MAKKLVQLELWVHFNSSTGYVWPQIYESEKEAHLDWKLNRPVKSLRLLSEPYLSDGENPFGTEVSVPLKEG